MEDLLRSRDKFYHYKYIVYAIILTKIVQLYCSSDLNKYTWGKYENGNSQIEIANVIKLKNGFDLHRKILEAIDYGQKIAKKIFPQNYSLEMEKLRRVYRVIM